MRHAAPLASYEGVFILQDMDWDDDRWRRVRAPRRRLDRR
jgi:hypothetical protein